MAMTKLYTINDLAAENGVSYHTIYYYLGRGLLNVSQVIGNQRIFDEKEFQKSRRIIELRKKGYPVRMIRDVLEEDENAKNPTDVRVDGS